MKLTTDYAIRTVMFLANCKRNREMANVSKISLGTGISTNYLMKILGPLKEANIVESMKGINGGYVLIEDPKKITLWQIIRIIEGPCYCVQCMDHEYCSLYDDPVKCKLRDCFNTYQNMEIEYFSDITIADLQ